MPLGRKTGGRARGVPNKATAGVKAVAQQYTNEAVEVLVAIMRDVTAVPNARVAAAKEILERGHGKSPQAVELSGPNGEPVKIHHHYAPQPAA